MSKLSQTKDGVLIECASIRVNHNFKRKETTISGEIYIQAPPSSRTTYLPGDAVELALEAFSLERGFDSVDFGLMKFIDTSPRILYTCTSSLKVEEMRLSYKVDLNHENFLNRSSVYIDALNGNTIKLIKNLREIREEGGMTLTGYYGTRQITLTQSTDSSIYYGLQ